MASLEGVSVASSYTSLLKLNGNLDTLVDGDGSNAIQIVDGNGTGSPLYLNKDKLGIGGQPHVNSTLNVKNSSGTAFLYITSANDADSAIVLEENTTAKWIIGNDGNDSDNLKFGTGGGWASETKMTLTSGGLLGIGTASPAMPLHIKNSSGGRIMLHRSAEDSSSLLGSIMFGANDGDTNLAMIAAYHDGATDAGALSFETEVAGGAITEKMRIDSAGNVGIGTESPEEKIHSTGAIVSTGVNNTGATAGTERAFIDLVSNKARIGHFRGTTSAGSGGLQLYTDSVERMRIDSSGNVDIGRGSTQDATLLIHSGSLGDSHLFFDATDGDRSGIIRFKDQGTVAGFINYRHEFDKFEFGAGSASSVNFIIDNNSRISLSNNDAGNNSNTFFGKLAGDSIQSGGNDNCCFGHEAGKALTTGDTNTLLGTKAGTAMATGQNNVMIGNLTGDATDGSSLNVFIGSGAVGASDATQNGTVAVGYNSLHALTSGSGNTAVGYQSMDATDDGSYNTAVGYTSLSANSGDSNTCIGYASGLLITGSMNTTIGTDAGNSITSGTNNVVIGKGSDTDDATATNQTVIGYNATGTGDNEIALGNTSITAIKAQVSSITAYSSDERTKKDIQDYNLKGLDFIKDLQLKTYIYKNPADFPDEIRSSKWNEEGVEKPADPTETQVGLIAQEVEEALKKHGIGNVETYAPTQDSGIKTLTYGNLIFPLIKAVQELSAKVTELENK